MLVHSHPPPFGKLPAKLIRDPIWVYAVPAVSFFFNEYREKLRTRGMFVLNCLLELILVVPAWTVIWTWVQLSIGWAWI